VISSSLPHLEVMESSATRESASSQRILAALFEGYRAIEAWGELILTLTLTLTLNSKQYKNKISKQIKTHPRASA
jgi:hypothetical protein